MNNDNNSEYYKQKYLKYKFKYLEQKKLIGGEPEQCPEKFPTTVLGSASKLINMLKKFNCNYSDIKGQKEHSLYRITKKELEETDNIKLLKKRGFPLSYFLSSYIAEIKKFSRQTLKDMGIYDDKLDKLELEIGLLKTLSLLENIDMTDEEFIELFRKSGKIMDYVIQPLEDFLNSSINRYMRGTESNRQPLFHALKNMKRTESFTSREFKKMGFSPLILYANLKSNKKLVDEYYYLHHNSIIIYLLKNFFPEDAQQVPAFNEDLKKLISIANLNKFYQNIMKMKTKMLVEKSIADKKKSPVKIQDQKEQLQSSDYYEFLSSYIGEKQKKQLQSWDANTFLSFYTDEEQKKIKGELPLEPKDETVRLKYIGTASEFKEIGFTLDELRGEFTPVELTAAGFSV